MTDICFFFFKDTATTEIYTLSLHDALPIYPLRGRQLGIAHARRVGHWLAGAPRRFGNHAVHLLSAKWRDGPRSYFGGAHLRPRAHLRVLAKRGEIGRASCRERV